MYKITSTYIPDGRKIEMHAKTLQGAIACYLEAYKRQLHLFPKEFRDDPQHAIPPRPFVSSRRERPSKMDEAQITIRWDSPVMPCTITAIVTVD